MRINRFEDIEAWQLAPGSNLQGLWPDKGHTERIMKGLGADLGYLELSLNDEKTKVVDARKESFSLK